MMKKEVVKLRQRKQPSGNISLYLDIYVNGRRRYEYLHLYLVPGTSKEVRAKNKETLRLAEAVQAKRVVEVQNGIFGFEDTSSQIGILEYTQALIDKKYNGDNITSKTWRATYLRLKNYCKTDIPLANIDHRWVNGFIRHLGNTQNFKSGTTLSQNTQFFYFSKLKAIINQALRDGLIHTNPLLKAGSIKAEHSERVYLTLAEVRAMASVEYKDGNLKRAFLFSCLTGLRKSDIEKMTWGEVREENGHTRIVFRQQKTGGQEYIDLSSQAVRYMGERGKPEELVFRGFRYNWNTTQYLTRWAKQAGVEKRLTFHAGRHTFAVLMLELGTDIYTVSRLLGHKDIKTTQIYANITDKKKQEAVAKIPEIEQ